MAAKKELAVLKNILNEFNSNTNKIESFLSSEPRTAKAFKTLTKQIYDFSKSQDSEDEYGEALPQLIIDDFDDEQVWQQIELQNESLFKGLTPSVARIAASKTLSFNLQGVDKKDGDDRSEESLSDQEEQGADIEEEVVEEEEDGSDEPASDHEGKDSEEDDVGLFDDNSDGYNSDESEEEVMLKKLLDKAEGKDGENSEDEEANDNESNDEDSNDDEVDFNDDGDKEFNKSTKQMSQKRQQKTNVVDDTFFKLADMESFLEQEDMKEEKKHSKHDGDSEGENEDFDVWVEDESDDDQGKSARDFKYGDFFDDVKDQPPRKRVKFQDQNEEENSEENSSDEEDDDDERIMDSENKKKSTMDLLDSESEGEEAEEILGRKSSYEKRQERLQSQIKDMEEAALEQKPWQLMGESAASSRPLNSLLEEDLDFEQQSKQAPAITEEVTRALEDIIKQRIKDKAWDDVERKVKPTEDVYEYKKRIELDQEKSKLSLGEIYEQEYLKQAQKEEDDKEDPQHEDIRKMMQSLFVKLDALSNFHYTPKPTAPDIKIINNQPSIKMEEVQPVSVSDANMLAPQEIKEKQKKELKGEEEKTSTDKNRARREKKLRQRKRKLAFEKKQKLLEKTKPGLGNKYAKERAMQELERQSKSSSAVNIIKDDKSKKNKAVSSTQFFSQLQDEVKTQIRKKNPSKGKKTDKKSSIKLKL